MLTVNKTNKVESISFGFNHQYILISLPFALQFFNQTLLIFFLSIMQVFSTYT
jgi:hypothetical protein